MTHNVMVIDSPIGLLRLIGEGEHLVGLYMNAELSESNSSSSVLEETQRQLGDYFAGTRREFDLPLKPHGTEFQRRVWRLLLEIPYGKTISYGELASRVGDRKASRAVGAANGRNPISIIVPCHRVIGASGDLTGFGGGLPRKEWLLRHEASQLNPSLFDES